ncbi:MAG: alpha-galactosidase [Candidatus Poribacteria bacterium]|nr:alpha-galactosidase [Candidatus Poribacteria bacterium]
MKLEDLAISRRGKLVEINHQKYQIEFNLSKGTWNYSNKNGKTVIKNAFTQIALKNETVLKTSDAGFREFTTGPLETDAFGKHQTLRFSYETAKTNEQRLNSDLGSLQQSSNSEKKDNASGGTGIRIHTYLTCYADQPYILLKVGVENLNLTPIGLKNITLIDISAKSGGIQLGEHPSQYQLFLKIPPIVLAPGTPRKIYDGFSLNPDNTSQPCQDGILHDTDDKSSLVFGFITTNKWWPRMQIGYQASKRKSQQGLTSWALYHDCEHEACQTGEEVTSEIGYLDFSDNASSAYMRYTERLAAENGADTLPNLPENNSYNGQKTYSSWSLSSENIQEDLDANNIIEQTRSIAQSPLFKPELIGGIDCIHLEAGWQANPGYLSLDADRFPKGMMPVVKEIHAKGFKASICIDPFIIDRNSELVQKHPEVCLQPKNSEQTSSEDDKQREGVVDKPVEVHLPGRAGPVAILDVSHPETQLHVQKILKQIVDEWGYDLIKADLSSYTSGMMSVAPNVTWHDSSLTSAQLYRLAVRLLKEAVEATENEVVLAGYNVVESASIGSFTLNYPLLRQKYVDNSDSWHQQNGTKHRFSRYIGHLNTHKILWHHAYGDLIVDEPRPINEAIVEMTAAALSGAAVSCASPPSTFSMPRAKLVAKLFPLSGEAATPIDHYDEAFPRILHLPVKTPHESWNLVGIFNWKDQQDDLYLNLEAVGLNSKKDYLVHDFWMRQYLGIVSKNVTLLNIAPRSAKLLCFREEQKIPQLLSTDMHYTQGSVEILSAGWDNHSQSFLLICQPPRQAEGTFFIHVPEGYIPIGVSAYGSDYRYEWNKPIYQLTFGATESLIHASIQFTTTSGSSTKP